MCKYGSEDSDQLGPAQLTIISLIKENSRILEFGCATGYMTRNLREIFGSYIVATDIDSAAVKRATKYADEISSGDLNQISDLGLENSGPYDVMIFADVLEHLQDPEQTLNIVKAWLKPGGQILISLPNIAFWEVRKDLALGRFDYTNVGILDNTHLHFYTKKSLYELASKVGMNVSFFYSVPAYFPLDRVFRWKLRPIKRVINSALMKISPKLFAYQFVLAFEKE